MFSAIGQFKHLYRTNKKHTVVELKRIQKNKFPVRYLSFLYCTLLATQGAVPEAEEPGRGGGAGECEGGALLRDRPLQRQRGLHLHPHDLLSPR